MYNIKHELYIFRISPKEKKKKTKQKKKNRTEPIDWTNILPHTRTHYKHTHVPTTNTHTYPLQTHTRTHYKHTHVPTTNTRTHAPEA